MKAFIISAFLSAMALADHDLHDFSHHGGVHHRCTLAEECDAGLTDRFKKCSSLDLCYDWERHNPGGYNPKEHGDDSIALNSIDDPGLGLAEDDLETPEVEVDDEVDAATVDDDHYQNIYEDDEKRRPR